MTTTTPKESDQTGCDDGLNRVESPQGESLATPPCYADDVNRRRSDSCKKAWEEGKGKLAGKKRRRKPCKCGCGELTSPGCDFIHGHNHRGTKHDEEWKEKQAEGLRAAHKAGKFDESYRKRKEKTLASRPLCKCGCGRPVERAGRMYAPGCFDATTDENREKALAARDWEKLRPEYSERMAQKQKEWKETGELDAIRRKARQAKGMPDHVSAKSWVVRDPYGKEHSFSNLAEWARQNEWRFVDDRPESRAPFWKRIAGGIRDMIKKDGRSCSYRGWTIVSKA